MAVAVDPYLFSQVMAITLRTTRNMLMSGDADDFLVAATPGPLPEGSDASGLPDDQKEALSVALSGLALIGDLAGARVAGSLDGATRADLVRTARDFDRATAGSFGLVALADEVLLDVDAKAASHPLATLAAAWMRTPDWQESETFLIGHSELTSEEGRAALAYLAEASPENVNVVLHVKLLTVACRDSIGAAYDQLRTELKTERLTAVIRSWLACPPDWQASAAYHDQHAPELADPVTAMVLTDACRRQPGDSGLWLHLGLVLLGDSRAEGYRSAATGDPDPSRRARDSLDRGDLDSALAWAALARARERGPGALLMARVQLARQQLEHAAEALAEAESHVPTSRMPEVLAAYDQAIALAPDNPSMHFNKGSLLFALGRMDQAAAELQHVLRLRPEDVLGARVLLGAITWPIDQDEARQQFADAIASPGERLTAFARSKYRAVALAGIGQLDDALRELESALAARPADETPDNADTRLLQLLQRPPLPGLDLLLPILEPPVSTAT